MAGILIEATGNISVLVTGDSPESAFAFTAIPAQELGMEYYVISGAGSSTGGSGVSDLAPLTANSDQVLVVVAVNNDTVVDLDIGTGVTCLLDGATIMGKQQVCYFFNRLINMLLWLNDVF